MLNKDAKLKAERGYTDPRSFVRNDGSEVLYGRDWTARKQELAERSGGRCEYVPKPLKDSKGFFRIEGVRCSSEGVIPAHYPKPRHPVRDDRLSNLMDFCVEHDRLMEPQAWRKTRFGEGAKPVEKRVKP